MIKLWCIVCEAYRMHAKFQDTELARCIHCNNFNWIPMGDID